MLGNLQPKHVQAKCRCHCVDFLPTACLNFGAQCGPLRISYCALHPRQLDDLLSPLYILESAGSLFALKAMASKASSPLSPDSLEAQQSLGDLIEKHRQQATKRTILATSRFALAVLVLVTAGLFYFRSPATLTTHQHMSAHHPLEGWHDRLQPFHGTFTPNYDALEFAQIHSTRVEPGGIAIALFSPNIVVDARGVVSTLSETDWAGLKSLAEAAVSEDLPQTGSTFMNQWRIKHPRTDFPISWLRFKTSGGLKNVAVYGFDGSTWTLEPPVENFTELPQLLRDVFGTLSEARAGYQRGSQDAELLSKVKAILPED